MRPGAGSFMAFGKIFYCYRLKFFNNEIEIVKSAQDLTILRAPMLWFGSNAVWKTDQNCLQTPLPPGKLWPRSAAQEGHRCQVPAWGWGWGGGVLLQTS